MLAIITKMTLTQVSTWFANARRRLKKENKMTWEPKNRNDDDDDDDCSAHSDDESKPIKDKHSKHHLDHHKGKQLLVIYLFEMIEAPYGRCLSAAYRYQRRVDGTHKQIGIRTDLLLFSFWRNNRRR
jgi:hypothetical protein